VNVESIQTEAHSGLYIASYIYMSSISSSTMRCWNAVDL